MKSSAGFRLSVIAAVVVLPAVTPAQVNSESSGYFPFWVSTFDATESFTSMAFLNPAPAGASGRVTIRDGRFHDADGKRLRLLGTNFCFQGAFPEKDQAAAIAGHLRKLGMNVVRFHHMDNGSAPRGIWLPDQSALDPAQLDKLDWLIFQLKEHGIYTNLNLHVSRTYPGIPKDAPRAFRYGKGLDNFHGPFIQLQKDYAAALLTHTNPYTNTTYAEEPAVIVVELNNENSLTNVGWNDLREMPEPYLGDLTRQWQDWLAARYDTTAALHARWDEASEPLGEELLSNHDFSGDTEAWVFERHTGADMSAESVADPDAPGGTALELKPWKQGSLSWSLQFHQKGLDLHDSAPYTLEFSARADSPCTVSVAVMLDQKPWRACGLRENAELDGQWRKFSYTFKCAEPVPSHCRVAFNLNNRLGAFRFANVSLRRGGMIGLPRDQSLEARNIPIPPSNAGDAESADFWAFLRDTECAYVRGMHAHLKDELGVQAFVCNTQASYGRLMGLFREGTLSDFIDMHAYWQHPSFPGKPWDATNWHIGNTSMTADPNGGTLPRLAWHRQQGKPYTVSEYDHPAPNDHAAELFPMLASFAAFQDWDGIYQFCYLSRGIVEEEPRLTGYFELHSHPGKKVFLPIAALMFRTGAVSAGRDPIVADIPTGDIPRQMAVSRSAIDAAFREAYPAALIQPVAIRLASGTGAPTMPPVAIPEGQRVSSTGEVVWDVTDSEQSVYTVNAPAVRVAAGRIAGRAIALGDVTINVTQAEAGWAAVAVGALDGKPIRESSRILVVAVGRVENTNMGWNATRTSVSNHWGEAPCVAEGIAARVELPAGGRAFALDGTGNPKADVPLAASDGGVTLTIGPDHETLWYGVTPQPTASPAP
jgi:Carbohydrate binding domain